MYSDQQNFSSPSLNRQSTCIRFAHLDPPTATKYPPYYSARYPVPETASQRATNQQPQGAYQQYPGTEAPQPTLVGYPESSQRTMSHHSSLSDVFGGPSRLRVVTGKEHPGHSEEAVVNDYKNCLPFRRRSTEITHSMTLNSSPGLYPLMPTPSNDQPLSTHFRTYESSVGNQRAENSSFFSGETSTDADSMPFTNNDLGVIPTPTPPFPELANESPCDPNPLMRSFQMHPNYRESVESPVTQTFVFPHREIGRYTRKLYDTKDDSEYMLSMAMQTQSLSSIPMRNNLGWPQPSLGGGLDVRPDIRATEQSESPARATPEASPSAASIRRSESCTSSNPDAQHSSSATASSSGSPSKKKKSKMHQCELCHKTFPRPSGLKTHMNTHNNVKPFPCSFPNCSRAFGVRSNAKRHLRTHGIVQPSTSNPSPTPYVVGFSDPMVLQPPQQHQMSRAPFKLQWIPHSLSTRTNATTLRPTPDPDSGSNDGDFDDDDDNDDDDAYSQLPMPLPPVSPSSSVGDSYDQYEERNSYLEAGSHPYHPSQFKVLPGPITGSPRSLVAL